MDAVIGGLIGVLLTVATGLLGAWIQGRREHARWLRDQRLSLYLKSINAADAVVRLVKADPKELTPDFLVGLPKFLRNLDGVMAELSVLGKPETELAIADLIETLRQYKANRSNENLHKAHAARAEAVRVIRKDLGVPQVQTKIVHWNIPAAN